VQQTRIDASFSLPAVILHLGIVIAAEQKNKDLRSTMGASRIAITECLTAYPDEYAPVRQNIQEVAQLAYCLRASDVLLTPFLELYSQMPSGVDTEIGSDYLILQWTSVLNLFYKNEFALWSSVPHTRGVHPPKLHDIIRKTEGMQQRDHLDCPNQGCPLGILLRWCQVANVQMKKIIKVSEHHRPTIAEVIQPVSYAAEPFCLEPSSTVTIVQKSGLRPRLVSLSQIRTFEACDSWYDLREGVLFFFFSSLLTDFHH
jgi:hypothetical protein